MGRATKVGGRGGGGGKTTWTLEVRPLKNTFFVCLSSFKDYSSYKYNRSTNM